MQDNAYYSITTKRFVLRTRHSDWLEETQMLYNQVLLFYYNLFLDREEIQGQSAKQASRALEVLTIVGRDKQPVQHPLPWIKVPLYFRRAAINAAISAGKSYLTREGQGSRTEQFRMSVTFYKGMYNDFDENKISLKVWTGDRWEWICCKLHGNHFPEGVKRLSPSVVIQEQEMFLSVPIKQSVLDGRKAKERMLANTNLCCVQFTNEDAVAVCVILDGVGNQKSVHFLKGGRQYVHGCRQILDRIEKSQKSLGDQKENQPNKKYWIKLKNRSDFFSNNISRQIINISCSEDAGVIILPKYEENYQKIVMTKVGNWSPLYLSYKIRKQLSYKSWNQGILVLEVDAHDTGNKCAKCGAVIKKKKHDYYCPNGHQGNRYMNGAINMGRKCIKSFRKHAPLQI